MNFLAKCLASASELFAPLDVPFWQLNATARDPDGQQYYIKRIDRAAEPVDHAVPQPVTNRTKARRTRKPEKEIQRIAQRARTQRRCWKTRAFCKSEMIQGEQIMYVRAGQQIFVEDVPRVL